MKYLQDYMTAKQTNAFIKYDAFFAFSKEQFEEGKGDYENKDLVSLGNGLCCPRKYATELTNELMEIYNSSIAQDIADNGIDNIIKRELANHEFCITGDITDTVEALADYPGIDEEKVAQMAR